MKTLEEIKKNVMGTYPNKWIKVFYSKGAGYGSEPHNFEGKSIVDETLVEVSGSELSDFISQTKQELIEEIKGMKKQMNTVQSGNMLDVPDDLYNRSVETYNKVIDDILQKLPNK